MKLLVPIKVGHDIEYIQYHLMLHNYILLVLKLAE